MNHDSVKIATALATGIGIAAIAVHANQKRTKTGKEPWNPKIDVSEYDYIIAGDMDKSWLVNTPMLLTNVYDTKHEWGLYSIPQVHADNRVLKQVRGKLLGGSRQVTRVKLHSINGMMYTRGPKDDYDEWARLGNPGWTYDEVFPYFKKSESFHDPALPPDHQRGPKTNRVYRAKYDTFEPEFHGTEGPWNISYHHWYTSSEGFIRANEAAGIPRTMDPNGTSSLGVCRIQTAMEPNGTRHSLSMAFLGDRKIVPGGGERGTVRVVLKVHVERVLLEERDGVQTAIGIVFRDKHNALHRVKAKREVILSAGVFHTPIIMLASGIGHKIHESIPLVLPLPGVGQNMSDHVGAGIVFKAGPDCESVHTHFSVKAFAKAAYDYVTKGTGIFTSQFMETVAFVRLDDFAPEFVAREKAAGTYQELASGPGAPHIELMFCPSYFSASYEGSFPTSGNYVSIMPVILNPASRGVVGATVTPEHEVQDRDSIRAQPWLDPNIYSDPFDVRVMKEAIRLVRRIGKHMGQDPMMACEEHYPTEAVVGNYDDEALEKFIRQGSATFFHTCGTSKMGPASDPMAVVDHRLRVHGANNLRVVDSGIIPKVVAGTVLIIGACHTCAAVVMVAEKASDMLKEDWKNAPATAL
ncbi:hypothetical protein BG004_003512 [Podila humilis]|nr:hypothetical protein BG004_003512 [Podila humilis]